MKRIILSILSVFITLGAAAETGQALPAVCLLYTSGRVGGRSSEDPLPARDEEVVFVCKAALAPHFVDGLRMLLVQHTARACLLYTSWTTGCCCSGVRIKKLHPFRF